MVNKKYKIFYIGLHPNTLVALSFGANFRVQAVSYLEFLLKFRTFNPVNLVFKFVYFLRIKNKFRFLEKLFLLIFKVFSFCSTSLSKRYKKYLITLSENRYLVFDAEKDDQFLDFLRSDTPDLIVVNSWGMLNEAIINFPKFGVFNIHPSKLPQYKGALPTLWSLKNGDVESAVTYMLVDKSMDGGDVLTQHVFSIEKGDDSLSLEEKIEKIILDSLASDIEKYLSGEINPIRQNKLGESFTEKYYKYRKIDFITEKTKDIFNKVNLYPFVEPGLYCYFYIEKRKIKIRKISFVKDKKGLDLAPGFFRGSFLRFFVGTSDGILSFRLFLDLNFKDSFFILFKKYLV